MKNINCADLNRLYYDISLVDEKEVIKIFEQYDSDVLINYKNKSGFTLLDAATMGHKTSIVRYLLSKYLNPNMLNGRGGHAIITALMQTDSNNIDGLIIYNSSKISYASFMDDIVSYYNNINKSDVGRVYIFVEQLGDGDIQVGLWRLDSIIQSKSFTYDYLSEEENIVEEYTKEFYKYLSEDFFK